MALQNNPYHNIYVIEANDLDESALSLIDANDSYANYNSNYVYQQNHNGDFNQQRYPQNLPNSTSHGDGLYNSGYAGANPNYSMPPMAVYPNHYPPHQLYPTGNMIEAFLNLTVVSHLVLR